MTSDKFHTLFGAPPRKPETELTQREMDLAASVQVVAEEIILRTARFVKKETGQKNLVLAGGVSLNCVANGKLLRENVFDNIWIQPAAGDAGGALGAALFVYHQVLDGKREVDEVNDLQSGSYLGPAWTDSQIEEFLKKKSIPHKLMNIDALIDFVAESIDKGSVVGWFNGRMEFGPRALGNRSIIGDARSVTMQSTMNLKIKNRESFRPFAPSVLLEDVEEFFDISVASPYMLLVADVQKSRCAVMTDEQQKLFGIEKLNIPRSDIPAVTHVNFSARVQTVDARTNPKYHKLISTFKKKTGYGVIINTSFNVRGEPIVCSPEDAYLCFMRTEMDILVMENFLLLKVDQPALQEEKDWREIYELD